jgi:hypothetical protein
VYPRCVKHSLDLCDLGYIEPLHQKLRRRVFGLQVLEFFRHTQGRNDALARGEDRFNKGNP